MVTQTTETAFDLELERFRARLRMSSDDARRLGVIREFLAEEAFEQPEIAIEYATEAYRIAVQLDDRFATADALRHRGLAHYRLDDVDAAVRDLREAYENVTLHTTRSSDPASAELATSLALMLGEVANSSGDAADALHWYLGALDACEHCESRTAKIKVFEALGHLYSGLGDYTRALEHHFESLSLHDADADPDAIGVTHAAIATTYALSGDHDEAYVYASRALAAFRESGNRYLEVQALGNLSGILYSRGDLATALDYSLTAVTIYEALDDRLHTAASLVTVGNIYERQGDLDAALHCYLRAMRLLGDNVDERLHVSILASVGNIYRLTGAYNEALFMFEQALRISQEIDEPRLEYQLHESLSQVYEDLALPAQALEHHKQFARLRNELAGQERQKAIAELQVRFEVERAAREREALRARAQELEAENDRKQNELLSLALNLVQKDELLETLEAQLQELRGTSGERSNGVVDRLLTEIDSNRSSDANWKVFEQQLEVLHPDLIRRLSERYPTLTQTELKVCSLAAINLSNKDVASMLYMSVRTVETHRLNIRRKMDLPKESNLTAFLAALGKDEEGGERGAST
jgi:tetratricopeptide (TPR) repeat protein/DNA-binding CsgD family transcriptional regulator